MPRPRRGDSGRLLATTLPEDSEEEDDAEHFAPGFGTRRGTVCHCSRCLRRSGPLTDDPRQVVEDIADALADMDPEGAATGFNVPPEELEEQHRVLAGALTLAVERGDAEVLRTLLNGIEDYSMQVEVATRLVVPAAQHGHANLIHLLDQFEADLEEPDSARGGPPLMHAANNGHVAAINALLECGAYTESMDFQNQTALMVAVFSDRASSVEALLTGGALVDAEDCRGRTALSHAARYGSLDCIAVLAAHGADVFREDKDGRTPLEIAEECARFEAAAQLKRFEQRQRLRERKESRAREAAPAPKLDRKQLEEREAQALQHALALVEEVEAEAARKAARKHKAKRHKKKGKASGEPCAREAADPDSEPEASCSKPASKASPQAAARRGSPEPAAEPAAAKEPAASSSHAAGNGAAAQQPAAHQASNGSHAGAANGGGAADPLAEQRAAWEALLEEAASCRDEARQAALIDEVRAMAERCAAAGISVKYGKKLLGKLERCAGVRQLLRTAQGGEQLEAAVAQGRGLRSLLDEELLASAEAALQRQQEAAAAAAAAAAAEAARVAEAQRLLLQRQRDAAREAAQQAQRPQPAEWEAAAEAARRLQRLQLERTAQGHPGPQQQQQPQQQAVPRLANGGPLPLNLNGQPLTSLTPRQPRPHGQPAASPPPPPPQQQRQQAPAGGGLQDLFPLPAAGAHMHQQGLANLWQRPQQPAQPQPAVSLGGGGGFFSGSLFESSLPLPPRQSQPPPPTPPPQPLQQPQQQQQQQQGGATWHPFSGPEPVGGGSLGWLDSMLGPSPSPPPPGPLPGFSGGFPPAQPSHAGAGVAGSQGRFPPGGAAPLANGNSRGLGSAPDWGQPALPGQPRWS